MNTELFDSLARLIAKENLTIVKGEFSTASIDLKNRVMRLPNWGEVDKDIAEMMRAHEVAHALISPADFSHQTVDQIAEIERMPAALKDCLNICEDGRIEAYIKKQFPGYNAIFKRAYNKVFEQGFFGRTSIDQISEELPFHDRLNTLLKMGSEYRSKLIKSREEFDIYIGVVEAETFKDIIAVSYDLYKLVGEEMSQKNDRPQQENSNGEQKDQTESEGEESSRGPSNPANETEESEELEDDSSDTEDKQTGDIKSEESSDEDGQDGEDGQEGSYEGEEPEDGAETNSENDETPDNESSEGEITDSCDEAHEPEVPESETQKSLEGLDDALSDSVQEEEHDWSIPTNMRHNYPPMRLPNISFNQDNSADISVKEFLSDMDTLIGDFF